MKKTTNSSKIYVELLNQIHFLTDQVSMLRRRIIEIAEKVNDADQNLDILEEFTPDRNNDRPITRNNGEQKKSNIISFSAPGIAVHREADNFSVFSPLNAAPGKPLPSHIHDYRPLLQRDGLILLAWDKRLTEKGELYTAYWVTSSGIPRFYASKPHSENYFYMAKPHHKSYAAEDGIEFYGQKTPEYIVHVAPELMMSNPRHRELRQTHIEVLKEQGVMSDFEHKFLLTTAKKLKAPFRKTVKSVLENKAAE